MGETMSLLSGFSLTKDGLGEENPPAASGWEYLYVYQGVLGSVFCETTMKFQKALSCSMQVGAKKILYMKKSPKSWKQEFFNVFGSVTAKNVFN